MRVCELCGSAILQDEERCLTCGASLHSRVLKEAGSVDAPFGRRMLMWVILLCAMVAGLWMFSRYAFRDYHPVIAAQPEVSGTFSAISEKVVSVPTESRIEGPFIIISLQDLLRKRLVRFRDPEGIQSVPLIAYVTASGRIVTAMALSEGCRSTDFYLEGENIHCASCPSYWNASSLEAYACCQKYYPEPVESTMLGDEIRIDASLVRKWQPRS